MGFSRRWAIVVSVDVRRTCSNTARFSLRSFSLCARRMNTTTVCWRFCFMRVYYVVHQGDDRCRRSLLSVPSRFSKAFPSIGT